MISEFIHLHHHMSAIQKSMEHIVDANEGDFNQYFYFHARVWEQDELSLQFDFYLPPLHGDTPLVITFQSRGIYLDETESKAGHFWLSIDKTRLEPMTRFVMCHFDELTQGGLPINNLLSFAQRSNHPILLSQGVFNAHHLDITFTDFLHHMKMEKIQPLIANWVIEPLQHTALHAQLLSDVTHQFDVAFDCLVNSVHAGKIVLPSQGTVRMASRIDTMETLVETIRQHEKILQHHRFHDILPDHENATRQSHGKIKL